MNDHEERKAAEAASNVRKFGDLINTPQALEHLRVAAAYRRKRYEAYVAVGFDAGQALWLCVQD